MPGIFEGAAPRKPLRSGTLSILMVDIPVQRRGLDFWTCKMERFRPQRLAHSLMGAPILSARLFAEETSTQVQSILHRIETSMCDLVRGIKQTLTFLEASRNRAAE